MTTRSADHTTFAVERTYPAPHSKAFAAWASAGAKAAWFFGPRGKWTQLGRRCDFRVGGAEHVSGHLTDGPVTKYDAVYRDIVPNERLALVHHMHLDDRKISVSLATVEFRAAGKGTKMTHTEQAVFLDGYADGGFACTPC